MCSMKAHALPKMLHVCGVDTTTATFMLKTNTQVVQPSVGATMRFPMSKVHPTPRNPTIKTLIDS